MCNDEGSSPTNMLDGVLYSLGIHTERGVEPKWNEASGAEMATAERRGNDTFGWVDKAQDSLDLPSDNCCCIDLLSRSPIADSANRKLK